MSAQMSSSAAASQRQKLLPSLVEARHQVSHGRFVEDHYNKSIAELAGQSFKPLAGFTVTFGRPMAESTVQNTALNEAFFFNYVEYTTGFRLIMHAFVILDEGYYPLGVSWDAFNDAMLLRVEALINECGYTTLMTPPSGLRAVVFSPYKNWRLSSLFDMDKELHAFVFDKLAANVEFEETEEHLVFRIPTQAVMGKAATELGGPSKDHEPQYVHRSALGILVNYVGKTIWAGPDSTAVQNVFITDEKAKGLTYPKHIQKLRKECMRLDMHTVALNITPIQVYPDIHEGVYEDLYVEDDKLVMRHPKDWMGAHHRRDAIHFDKPEDWFRVSLRPLNQTFEGVSLRSESYSNSFDLFYLDKFIKGLKENALDPSALDETEDQAATQQMPDSEAPPAAKKSWWRRLFNL